MVAFFDLSHLIEGHERLINISLSVTLVLLIFVTKNVWADFRIKMNEQRLEQAVATDRLKKNSIHKISQEEYEYQCSDYTRQ